MGQPSLNRFSLKYNNFFFLSFSYLFPIFFLSLSSYPENNRHPSDSAVVLFITTLSPHIDRKQQNLLTNCENQPSPTVCPRWHPAAVLTPVDRGDKKEGYVGEWNS
jgi:hypothetical protein